MPRDYNLRWRLALPVVLISLPLIFLLIVAVYFLRQDKLLVDTEARETAAELGRMLMTEFTAQALRFPPAATYTNANPWPATELFFQLDTNNALLFPPPIESNLVTRPMIESLPAAQSNFWREAEQSEFIQQNSSRAIDLWQQIAASTTTEPAHAIAQFNAAVLLEKSGRTNEARSAYQELRHLPPSIRFDRGYPVAHLAELNNFQLTAKSQEDAVRIAWRFLREPTDFSPFLIRQLPPKGLEWASEVARSYQQSRDLFAAWNSTSNAPAVTTQNSFVIPCDGTNWWVVRNKSEFFARSEPAELWIYLRVLAQTRIPSYLGFALFSQGRLLNATGDYKASKTLATTINSETGSNLDLRLDLFLADPQKLYARQQQRALWLGGLLAIATFVAIIGLAQNTRSLYKQERLSELKSNFLSSVSHELRAPLASMRLMSEGLAGGRIHDREKQLEYFHYLVQECRRLSWLVENVLDFSRIERERKTYEFEPTNLAEVIESSIKSIQPIAAEANITITFPLPAEPHTFVTNADPFALQQALVNLLDNAVKHSPAHSQVSVTLKKTATEFQISIQDRGPGIPVSEHKQIFERFYRLGSELRRETAGVGIGLSIVKHIAEAHSGRISVSSEPGHGATFTLSLPLS